MRKFAYLLYYSLLSTLLWSQSLQDMPEIDEQAYIGEGFVDYVLDESGGVKRYRDVKRRYDRFEVWHEPIQYPQGHRFYYDSTLIAKIYHKPQSAIQESFATPQRSYSFEVKSDNRYRAHVYIFPGVGDKKLFNKTIIIGDAFDPINERDVTEILTANRYKNLLAVSNQDEVISPREMGYDIVFVDFLQGGGKLQLNAKLLTRVVQEIQKHNEGPIVMAGISMSGLLARLSLLMSQKDNNFHQRNLFPNVKAWLSIDSPQEGAVIGSLQRVLWSMILDEDLELASDFADANNQLGLQFYKLNVPAAHQMLKSHYYRGNDFLSVSYQAFHQVLKNMGAWPDKYGVGIAYSSWYKPHALLDNEVPYTLKRLVIRESGVEIISRGIVAGGPHNSIKNAELEPGSTGNWYYDLFGDYQAQFMKETYLDPNGEKFKGTFIPIRSALALGSVDWRIYNQGENPQHPRAVARDSKFNRVFWMNGMNDYAAEFFNEQVEPTIDDNRYEHMVFDKKLMGAIEAALIDIENSTIIPTSSQVMF